MNDVSILEEVKRIKAISDIGLLYAENDYDKERYEELRDISYSMLSRVTGLDDETLKIIFPPTSDYPTPKVDIRGILLSSSKQILLVREGMDGKWSLPGGWADIGFTPKEVITKEFKEETGLEVIPRTLLAVFDKRMHAHPPQAEYVYKMVFHCEPVSTVLNKGFDVLDVQFFAIDALPELSKDRILESQIRLVYNKLLSGDAITYFD